MTKNLHRSVTALAVTVFLCLSSRAYAQWMVTSLHPTGASESYAFAANGTQQVGHVNGHAGVWSGSAASWAELHPPGLIGSQVFAISGTQQAGFVGIGSYAHAALWTGNSASWVDLNPAGSQESMARGIGGNQQVGNAWVGGVARASLWTGTASSWVDLNPAGSTQSTAFATNGVQQGGYANMIGGRRAILWSGGNTSWEDLTPAGSTQAEIYGLSDTQQVGRVAVGSVLHASLWTGTSSSWVDLHPSGANFSAAYAIRGTWQVGFADMGGVRRASLWSGTAGSWVDLHALLPVGFSSSEARGVSSDGTTLYIAGYGYNTVTNRTEALLWTRPIAADGPLIDNLAEPVSDASPISTGISSLWAAQGFRTDARSYQLTSIDTIMGNLTGGAVLAELHSGDDPTGPLVTTLSVGTVPSSGLAEVTLTPVTPTFLTPETRYFVVVYGPEGTAYDWAYAQGNNYVGPGFFDSFWYSTDLGANWINYGGDNPFFLRVNVSSARRVEGTVTLEDWDAPRDGMPIDIEIRDIGGTAPLQTVSVTLDASGNYSFALAVPSGTYDLLARGSHWLQRLNGAADLSSWGPTVVNFTLTNGDCDGDNEVGIGDYAILSGAYNSAPGDSHWSASADLNGDESVDIADYAILSANYGRTGDP